MTTLIIAPSFRIACMIARGRELRLQDFVYVRSLQDVQGYRVADVLCYHGGGSWSLRQWHAYDYLTTFGDANMVDVRESELVP